MQVDEEHFEGSKVDGDNIENHAGKTGGVLNLDEGIDEAEDSMQQQ